MTMAQGNLLGWANDIRLTMAKDTGRGFFQHAVQTQGFLFLDDYLENILAGPKKDPLIELVKTPGRRKIVGKKPKAASKLGTPIVFSLGLSADENAPPATSSSRTPFPLDSETKKSAPLTKLTESKSSENRSVLGENLAQMKAPRGASPVVDGLETLPEAGESGSSEPIALEQANLSAIAEDEEPSEKTRMPAHPPNPPPPKASSSKRCLPETSPEQPPALALPDPPSKLTRKPAENGNTQNGKEADPLATRHSHPDYHSAHGTPVSTTFSSNKRPKLSEEPQEEPNITERLVPPQGSEQDAEMDDDEVANQLTDPTDTDFTTKFTNDVTDTMDIQVPLRDADAQNKTTSMAIPSLPDPMPLRKSMRAPRDPSVHGVMQGAATPGNPAGKRTSWLIKAREIKALDKTVVIKKPTVGASTIAPLPNGPSTAGSKRKSDVEVFPSSTNETEHKAKVPKHADGDNPSSKAADATTKALPLPRHPSPVPPPVQRTSPVPQTSPGVLERLKQTMESLVGKTPAPSKTNVFSAIAEARAAAEARIAERDRLEDAPVVGSKSGPEQKIEVDPDTATRSQPMSIDDLFPAEGKIKDKGKAPEKPFQFSAPPAKKQEAASHYRDSTSTTPPHSPPPASNNSSFIAPSGPVFKQPAPVFVPPAPVPAPASRPLPSPPAKEYTFHAPPQSMFTAALGINSPFSFGVQKEKAKPPLTAQSTVESVASDRVFDDDDVPAWVPQTQETEYTAGYDTQPATQDMNICDEDDSWPVDEKLAAGVQWTYGAGVKDDSMTWSTLPSQSQRGGDTTRFTHDKTTSSLRNIAEEPTAGQSTKIPGSFDFGTDHDVEGDLDRFSSKDKELEDAVMGSVRLVTHKSTPQKEPFRPQSQMSIASSSSQETSQGGFLNQASKLFTSALGGGKKKQAEVVQPEVRPPEKKKTLTKAAAAVKKQQEEADKKATRLKEMEVRRQQAMQKKAEEEKARQVEEEKKVKEEMERRKREREEQEKEKRSLVKPTPIKKSDDPPPAKKPLPDKKELKKTASTSSLAKSQLKPALKSSTLHKTPTWGGSGQAGSSKTGESSKLPKFAPSSSSKAKAKAAPLTEEELGQPSQLLHDQMAARAKAQIMAAKHTEPVVPSESIELPDINSEYSDSDDEDRKRTYDPPDWAQSPDLKKALEIQSTINPDDIFGAVRPLKMEEIFKTRTSRFRARTSSANWTGTDRLTVAEEKEYAVRMGFK